MSSANTMPTPPTSPTPGNYSGPRPTENMSGSWATYEPPVNNSPIPYTSYDSPSYRPTAEQLARDEARRQSLRRSVYFPITITVIILVALLVLIILMAFGVPLLGISTAEAVSFIAGLSALIVILFAIPAIFLMAILPIAWLAITINRRQQRKNYPQTGPMAYRSRVQTLLWQLESFLDGARRGVEVASDRVRKPLVNLHARAEYLREFLRGLWENFTRSI